MCKIISIYLQALFKTKAATLFVFKSSIFWSFFISNYSYNSVNVFSNLRYLVVLIIKQAIITFKRVYKLY